NFSAEMFHLPLRHQRRKKNRSGIEGHRKARNLHGEQQQGHRRNAESVDRKWRLTDAAVQGRHRRQSNQRCDRLRENALKLLEKKKKPPKFKIDFGGKFFRSTFLDNSLTGAEVTSESYFRKLLQNRVFQSLCRAQAHDCLGLDLDRFAGLGIAAHARLAVRLHNAADSRNDELARGTLGFFHRKLVQLFKKERRLLLRCAELLGDMRNDLGLAEWLSCHLVCLSSCRFLSVPRNPGGLKFFPSTRTAAKKIKPWGTIANAAWERKSNWSKNAVKMPIFAGRCGNRGHLRGFLSVSHAITTACYSFEPATQTK